MTDELKKGVEGQISEALRINETKIEEELLRQPSLFFYWSMGWALAARKRRMHKLAARRVEAELTKEFRLTMSRENPGLRLTEKMINDYLSEHPTFQESQTELIKSEYTEDMLNIASVALKEKHQILIELHKNNDDVQLSEFSTIRAFKDEVKQRERKRSKKREVIEDDLSVVPERDNKESN